MATYYVIERGQIINAVEASSRERAEAAVAMMMVSDLTLLTNPPKDMLERYRYWNERP